MPKRSSAARSSDGRIHRRSPRCLGSRADLPILPIAPSTYHEHIAQRRKPARARQDIALKPEIARVFAENFAVCCVRKVWRQTMRKGFPIARCTVARLMREMAWRRNPWPAGAYDQAMASASTCGTQGQGLQPASLPFLLRRYQLRPTRHEFSHSYKQWARRL